MKALILLLFMANISFAEKYSVMTFNTMCDFCNGSDFFGYHNRINSITDTIKRLGPDLISLQEVRSEDQIKKILAPLTQYNYSLSHIGPFSYADPTIIYDKSKFQLIKDGHFWLGPNNGNISLGWKYSLPRQVRWAKFLSLSNKKEFLFLSSHIDNRYENMEGSIKMIRDFLADKKIPIIFAADTNMTVDMIEYKKLTQSLFLNAYDLRAQFTTVGNYQTDSDLCYLKKGDKFPMCRVDHILLSQANNWKVHTFIIDATKYNNSFTSDHRAVMSIIEFL